MVRINLLPWREERRKHRQKEFLILLGASAIAAVLLSFLIVAYYNAQIGGQNERDLSPLGQDRMQRLAEYLWQSNLLANRLVELPLASTDLAATLAWLPPRPWHWHRPRRSPASRRPIPTPSSTRRRRHSTTCPRARLPTSGRKPAPR